MPSRIPHPPSRHQPHQPQTARQGPAGETQVRCSARVIKMVVKDGAATGSGFFHIDESSAQAVTTAFGRAAVAKDHYFRVAWLPSVVRGSYQLPVGPGDTLTCLISRDRRPLPGQDAASLFPRQIKLDRCAKLSRTQMQTFLCFISATAATSAEDALLALSPCAAVWRYVLAQPQIASGDGLGVRQVLETLHLISKSRSLHEKKRDLCRSVTSSAFFEKDGALALFLRASRDSPQHVESGEHAARLNLAAVAIDETVSLEPEAARSLYDLLSEFFSGDSRLLLSLVQRLSLPASARVEQLLWNELPLLISPRELLGEIDPLLLTPAVVSAGPYGTPADYYDTYYRLMRYDGFGKLRNGIHALLSGKLDKRDMSVYKDVAVCGLRFGHGAGAGLSIALSYRTLFGGASSGRPDKIMYGNLVCLSLDGSFQDPIWAVVEDCDIDSGWPQVFVSLCTEENTHDDLTAMLLLLRCTTTLMVESPTYFRAVQPVLRALKQHDLSALPFEDELVYARRGPPPAYITSEAVVDAELLFPSLGTQTTVSELLRSLKLAPAEESTFDRSQREAIHAALTQRVVIIQGPPGTGKSTVGRSLARLILSMDTRPRGPILVITYKNHALDEFLEGCAAHVPLTDIVRVGSRSKSTLLQQSNLKQLLAFGSPLVSGKTSVVDQQTNDLARTLRQEIGSLVPLLQLLSSRRRNAMHISEHTALAAFLACADEQHLESMWLDRQRGVGAAASNSLIQLAALIEETLPGLSGDSDSSSLREACRFCVLTAQEHSGVDEASRIELSWEAHRRGQAPPSLVLPEDLGEKQLRQVGRAMCAKFKKWLPPSRDFAHIQRRMRPSVLPSSIASTGVDPSISLVETSDMVDADSISARRRMAGDEKGGSIVFVDVSSRSELRLDELDQPLARIEKQHLRKCDDIWQRQPHDVPLLLAHMLMEDYLELVDEKLRSLNARYTSAATALVEIEEKRKADVLSNMKIVGMTSTGAALNLQALTSLKPGVVIIEEAAELLEPQLLAVLQPSVQHLIMIGDHEQLRPQVENYELVRAKSFDVSMFERLCNNGMLSATLAMQSRMRPEMVELLREVYPHVESHERVHGPKHDVPDCLRHSMYFWTHDAPELAERSCANQTEVNMIMKLVKWLKAEGVEPEKVTVLAAYSAQVKKLRDAIKSTPTLMKVDGGGRRSDTDASEQTSRSTARLSAVTIDEFQGDENDVIICSLVRSTPSDPSAGRRSIGYLSVRNRLVVAASRAKRALVFVGNADWLSNRTVDLLKRASTSQRLARWDLLAAHLRQQLLVGTDLPLACPRHPNLDIRLSSRAPSARVSGTFYVSESSRPVQCPEPCNAIMGCGVHACPRGCHSGEEPHAAERCTARVDFKYGDCGHRNSRRCCDAQPECEVIVPFAFPKCGHAGMRKCCVPERAIECEVYVPMRFKDCGHDGTRRCADSEASQKCTKPCARLLACGHRCPLLCHQPCSLAERSCKVCAAIKKAEDEERKRQIEEAIKSAKAKAKAEAKLHRARGGFFRKPLLPSDPAYMEACRIVHQNQPDHRNPIVVVGVEQVYNAALQAKFFECKQDLVDPTPAPLHKFHGTSKEGVDGICEIGFRQPNAAQPNMDKKSGGTKLPMYGHGIYLASDSTKSAQREYTRGSNMLLVCKTLLGRSLTLREPDNHLNKKAIHKKGYDSVFAPAGSAVRFDEYIVYDARQCVVEWVVHFRSGMAKPMATPWKVAGQVVGTATCRELVASTLGAKDSRELDEYNFALGHFVRLLGGDRPVHRIDVYDSPEVDAKYRAKKDEFIRADKPADVFWVFHGCPTSEGTRSICTSGFKVGGQDGHPISNGAAHGQGVYTATGPSTPMGYGSKSRSVILCKALVGSEGDCNKGDHWRPMPNGDWMIFRTAAQLLPKYVVHF